MTRASAWYSVVCVSLAIATPITVCAQVAPNVPVAPATGSSNERMASDQARNQLRTRETRDPLLSASVRSPGPQITAIATAADKRAKAQFGTARQLTSGTFQLYAAASTPLTENSKPATRTVVADLGDLPGVSSGEFGASFSFWRAPSRTNRDAAAALYAGAKKKIYDRLQAQIDAREALRPSATMRREENQLHKANIDRLDEALRLVDSAVVARSAVAYDTKVLPAISVPAKNALAALVAERNVLVEARNTEIKRHNDRVSAISRTHATTDADIDADVAALKARQETFKDNTTGKIVLLLDANPLSLQDPAFDQLVGTDLDEIQRLTKSSMPIVLSIAGSGGAITSKYVDSTTLTAMSRNATVQQVRLAAGVFGSAGLLSGFYSRQRSVTEQDETQLCRPFGNAGALQCSTLRIGAPSDTWKNLVGLEYRGQIGPSLILAVEGTRDLTGKTTTWNVPLYFMPKEPGGVLNGGIVIGGQSGQSGFTVKVFVGAVAPPFLR